MGFILILAFVVAFVLEAGALCVAVWLVCTALGMVFNLPVTMVVVGLLNLAMMRKLFGEVSNDDGE